MEEKAYSVKEIAYKHNVSTMTVYRWIDDGFLLIKRNPTARNRGRIFIFESQYNEFKKLFDKYPDTYK